MIKLLTVIAILFIIVALIILLGALGIYYIGEAINKEQRGDY